MAVRHGSRTLLRRGALSNSLPDDGDRSATIRALMFGAAGDMNLRVADDASERASDERTGVARRRNIGIIQHCVALAAQQSVVTGFGLGQHGDKALAFLRRKLTGCVEA